MNKYIILNKKEYIKKISILLTELGLKRQLNNDRTEIWTNDDIQISIDKSIIRVIIYSKSDIKKYNDLFIKG